MLEKIVQQASGKTHDLGDSVYDTTKNVLAHLFNAVNASEWFGDLADLAGIGMALTGGCLKKPKLAILGCLVSIAPEVYNSVVSLFTDPTSFAHDLSYLDGTYKDAAIVLGSYVLGRGARAVYGIRKNCIAREIS